MSEADITYANFSHATLNNAIFQDADLRNADAGNTQMHNVDLLRADLFRTDFSNAQVNDEAFKQESTSATPLLVRNLTNSVCHLSNSKIVATFLPTSPTNSYYSYSRQNVINQNG
ncbi:pentapeptide repeat-containing protein [Vibrio lentus]|nr:pentapeptide repeat-containing protein [Vibrio lentus]